MNVQATLANMAAHVQISLTGLDVVVPLGLEDQHAGKVSEKLIIICFIPFFQTLRPTAVTPSVTPSVTQSVTPSVSQSVSPSLSLPVVLSIQSYSSRQEHNKGWRQLILFS